jgi:hypothetical protein
MEGRDVAPVSVGIVRVMAVKLFGFERSKDWTDLRKEETQHVLTCSC